MARFSEGTWWDGYDIAKKETVKEIAELLSDETICMYCPVCDEGAKMEEANAYKCKDHWEKWLTKKLEDDPNAE